MFSVKYEKKSVVSYKELLILFVLVVGLLVVLYPRNLLEKQILSEKSNYDLSMLYLENMLKNDPSNESLMLALATQSLNSGNIDLASKLLELLHNSKDVKIQSKAIRLSYKLTKIDYYYFKENSMKREELEYYKKLQLLFKTISSNKFYEDKEHEEYYKEAIFLNDTQNSYKFVKKLLQSDLHDVDRLADAYYLSRQQHNTSDSLKYINLLLELDKERKKYWQDAKYYVIEQEYSKVDAEAYLLDEAKDSTYWKHRLVQYYKGTNEYAKASNVYISLSLKQDNKVEEVEYLKNALNVLIAGKLNKQAVDLANKHENKFLNSSEMRTYLLKFYMANGSLGSATRLSKKILQGDRS